MIKKSLLKIVCLLIIVSLNWAGLLAIGETLAFFSNNKGSNANTFTAAILDFSLNAPGDFSPDLESSQTTSNRTIDVSKDGSLGFQYRVRVKSATGGLCSYLELTDDLSGSSFQWLPSFVSGNTTFSNKSNWAFTARSSSFDLSLQGTICNFKLVFEGWQKNIANYGDGGFSDTEEVESTIKMGYWNPPVVLNEFLPNSGNYPEFIELYNKANSSIDLDGFYIMAGNNRININSANTQTYSSGLTTIAPSGWLVITAGGDLLNDTSDTITLYNPNDVEVDSYIYDASDYNINNNPGWTNNLVAYWPFNNDLGDKSGNGNNGTNYGASFTGGKINQALSFDGVDDYVAVSDSDSLDITSQITIEAWINPDTVLKPYYHSSIVDRGNSYWFLILDTGELTFLRFNQNDPQTGYGRFSILSTTATIPAGTWTHVAATYSVSGGNTVKLYINGQLSKEGSFTNGPIDSSSSALTIGNRMGLHNFDGKIDEVKIYNRALDATEILEHYNDFGSSGAVPLDKSYARIPDGSDNWVDPIPTPGRPNILESEIINQEPAVKGTVIEEPISDEIFDEETPIEEELIDEETPTIPEELITEEEPIVEDEMVEGPVIEETPITEQELIVEEETVEEPVAEEELIVEELIEDKLALEEQPIDRPEEEPEPEDESVPNEEGDEESDDTEDSENNITE